MGTFLSALKSTGLRKSDPRLKEMMDNLKQVQRRNADGFNVDTHKLNLQQFKRCILAFLRALLIRNFF